jgi:hypothetical protein
VIVSVAAFSGCIEEGTLEPTPTPPPVVTPSFTPTTTSTPTVTSTTTPTPTEENYLVTASVSQMMKDITITYLGGPRSESVEGITITKVGSATNVPYVLCEGTCPVGESVMFSNVGTSGPLNNQVIVTARFKDGATLVIYPPPQSTPRWWRGYMVTATAAQRANDIEVTYTGGPDVESLVGITIVKAGSATNVPYVICEGTCPVGESVTFSNAGNISRNIEDLDYVIVTATFEDGATLVILETYI